MQNRAVKIYEKSKFTHTLMFTLWKVDRIETDSVPLPALALIYTWSRLGTLQFTYMSADQKLIKFTFIYFTKKKTFYQYVNWPKVDLFYVYLFYHQFFDFTNMSADETFT